MRRKTLPMFGAVGVDQLIKQLLPIPEVRGSNTVICNFLLNFAFCQLH